jgi:hypothetical protein
VQLPILGLNSAVILAGLNDPWPIRKSLERSVAWPRQTRCDRGRGAGDARSHVADAGRSQELGITTTGKRTKADRHLATAIALAVEDKPKFSIWRRTFSPTDPPAPWLMDWVAGPDVSRDSAPDNTSECNRTLRAHVFFERKRDRLGEGGVPAAIGAVLGLGNHDPLVP